MIFKHQQTRAIKLKSSPPFYTPMNKGSILYKILITLSNSKHEIDNKFHAYIWKFDTLLDNNNL